MSALIHCVYTSAAVRNFGSSELAELLRRSREKNERLGLTGMLLYSEDTFFQVFEGPPDAVDALYQTVENDMRHQQVTCIVHEAIAKRAFGAWTMGFARVLRQDLVGIDGVNDFFDAGRCFADIDAGRAKKLLAAFAVGRWRSALTLNRPSLAT